jgi:chitinase
VCYWQRRISASLIDPNICTHIIFAFINTNARGELLLENESDEGRYHPSHQLFLDDHVNSSTENLSQLVQFKEQNARLRIMISMANNFRVISTLARLEFAENVKNFVDKYNLDGVDIDWEWPAAQDREFYVLLLQDMRKALTRSSDDCRCAMSQLCQRI